MEGWLCLKCRAVTPPNPDLSACPNCGDNQGIPADLSHTVNISITVHELRVLVMWAEFWASAKDDDEHKSMRKVLYGIASALQLQIPDGTSLTFSGELADLRSEFGKVEHNVIIEDKPER